MSYLQTVCGNAVATRVTLGFPQRLASSNVATRWHPPPRLAAVLGVDRCLHFLSQLLDRYLNLPDSTNEFGCNDLKSYLMLQGSSSNPQLSPPNQDLQHGDRLCPSRHGAHRKLSIRLYVYCESLSDCQTTGSQILELSGDLRVENRRIPASKHQNIRKSEHQRNKRIVWKVCTDPQLPDPSNSMD